MTKFNLNNNNSNLNNNNVNGNKLYRYIVEYDETRGSTSWIAFRILPDGRRIYVAGSKTSYEIPTEWIEAKLRGLARDHVVPDITIHWTAGEWEGEGVWKQYVDKAYKYRGHVHEYSF